MKKNWLFSILGLLLISSIAFLWNLGSTGLVDETEPLFAEAAREMTITGNWITPYFNGETRFDKPILIYWLMGLFYNLLGINEWAVRLPSALSAIALMILLFVTLRYFGLNSKSENLHENASLWQSACIGAAIFAFNPLILIWARTGVSDMLLTACIGGALLCFFWGYVQSEKQSDHFPNTWYVAFYILLALGVLTKGPVGFVLPGLIIFAFLLYLGNLKDVFKEIGIVWGIVIFLAISLPWYILVAIQNGEAFIDTFFGYHNFQRFTGVVNRHSGAWYYYFLIVLAGFFPYSIYLPLAITRVQFWRRSYWKRQPRYKQLGLFALCWFMVVFIFFTIAVTKLPSYVIPLIPGASILIALLWQEDINIIPRKYGLFINGIINVLLLIVISIAAIYLPSLLGTDNAAVNLPQSFRESGLPLIAGIVWGLTAVVVAFLLLKKPDLRLLIAANLIGFVAFLIFFLTPGLLFIDSVRQLPLREISRLAAVTKQENEDLFMVGFKKPSVSFYSQSLVTYADSKTDINRYMEANGDKSPPTVLIIGRLTDLGKMDFKEADYQKLESRGVYHLVRIDKRHLSR